MRESTGENLPLANAIRVGNTVYVSGQVPLDGDRVLNGGGIEVQTELALDNLEAALKSRGAGLNDVVKTTVFLANVKRDFHGMNVAYARRFGEHRPTRSTVGVELVIEVLVEIEAIAVVGEG